jgi:hypothetical protein
MMRITIDATDKVTVCVHEVKDVSAVKITHHTKWIQDRFRVRDIEIGDLTVTLFERDAEQDAE